MTARATIELMGPFDRSILSWFEWIVYRLVRGADSP